MMIGISIGVKNNYYSKHLIKLKSLPIKKLIILEIGKKSVGKIYLLKISKNLKNY
jgi:hypothetical protein